MLVDAAGRGLRIKALSEAADLQSLSLLQENGQSQANAPVYQQNGKPIPTAVPGRVASLGKSHSFPCTLLL